MLLEAMVWVCFSYVLNWDAILFENQNDTSLPIEHAYDSVKLGSETEILISSSHPRTVD